MFEKKKENNNSLLTIIIIVLLIIIAILAFFLGKNYNKIFGSETTKIEKTDNTNNISDTNKDTHISDTNKDTNNNENLVIEVIGDKRDITLTIAQLVDNLKNSQPSLKNAKFIEKDFSDVGVKEYLKANDINALPAILFSTKNFDNSNDPQNLKIYLKEIKDGKFTLAIPGTSNPFNRNEKGFMVIKDKNVIGKSYVKGDKNAKISILEYTDVQCPYCIDFHQTTYLDDLQKEFGSDINYVMKHFPLSFHQNAKVGAELLECFGEQKGDKSFYELVTKVFKEGKSEKSFIIDEAVKLGADKTKLEKCLNDNKYASKVDGDMDFGSQNFDIQGTPSVIFYNNKTGEYQKATRYIEADKEIITKLLK